MAEACRRHCSTGSSCAGRPVGILRCPSCHVSRIRLRANTWDEEVVPLPVAALLIISTVAGLLAWAMAGPVLRRAGGRGPARARAGGGGTHTAIRGFVDRPVGSGGVTRPALTAARGLLGGGRRGG